ncbi:hypothetical protein NOX22_09960 [Enterobacter cloacae]|uniref:hypothetical protein n=1 Tax=Enterobacter cloacae complex TaxID=354276 RepID=UPI00210E094C|nr:MULTISPECIES: hypothetical protein [Enterobacter cloacae complex]MCQ4444907.1 hypothetical protein [Enterobacter cloacae]MDW2870059.1 hypothetical protein [Enterobacter hormaechei]
MVRTSETMGHAHRRAAYCYPAKPITVFDTGGIIGHGEQVGMRIAVPTSANLST